MATKSANGGTLLYIRDTINNKLRPDFNVEKKGTRVNFHWNSPKNTQKCYNWLYSKASMYVSERIKLSLFKALTDRITKLNNKEVILMGDFNIDLFNSN